MKTNKKKGNVLCAISLLIILLGIGLFCVFKPAPVKEMKTVSFEEPMRTSVESILPAPSTGKSVSFADDNNIELIDT